MRPAGFRATAFFVSALCAAIFLFLNVSIASANSCASTGSGGNFNAAGSWTSCGGTTPQTTDTITINSGSPITLVAATTVAGVTINSGATLNGSTFLLTDTGNYINNGTHSGSGGVTVSGASAAISGSGATSNTGTFTVSGATAPTFAATSSLSISGQLMINGPLTITAGASVTEAATTTVAGGKKVTNNGTFTMTGTGGLAGGSSTSTWSQGSNSILNFAGNTTGLLATGVLSASSTVNTVDYSGAAQTCKNTQYYNLEFSGSGTKTCTTFTSPILSNLAVTGTAAWTLGAALVVDGNLSVAAGTLTTAGFAFTVDGTTEVSGGTFSLGSNTGNKTFIGLVTVDGGTLSGASTVIIFENGITQSSGSVAITGTATFITNTQALNGTIAITTMTASSSATVTNNDTLTATTLVVSSTADFVNAGTSTIGTLTIATGSTITNDNGAFLGVTGTFTVTGTSTNSGVVVASSTLTGAGSWVQGANATLYCNGGTTNAMAVTNVDFHTNAGNTVIYEDAGNQTAKATSYQNLTLAGSGTKTMTSITTVNGNFLATGGTATAPFTTVGGTFAVDGGTVTLGAALVVDGNLSVAAGTLTTGAFAFTVDGTTEVSGGTFSLTNSTGAKALVGLVTVDGGTVSGASTSTVLNGGINQTSGSVAITGGVIFATSSQAINGQVSIASITVGPGITVTNSASTTVSGAAFVLTGNWTQDVDSYLEFSGSITFSGSGTFDASDNPNLVQYDRSGAQTCLTATYYDLVFAGSGAKTCATPEILDSLTIEGTASWTMSATSTLDNLLTIAGGSLTTAAFPLTVASTTEISSGSLTLNNSTGAKTFNGLIQLDGGTLSGNSTGIVTNGGILNNAGTVSITGTDTFSASDITLDGTNTIAIATIDVASGGAVENDGAISSSGTSFTDAGSWVQGAGSSLEFTGNIGFSITGTFDASDNQNTVIYDRTNSETCFVTQYYNLTFGGTGNKTCALTSPVLGNLTYGSTGTWTLGGALTVDGNMTITNGTIDVSAGNNWPVNLDGNFTNSGGVFNTETDTVTLQGTSPQTLSGAMTGTSDFYNLAITNNSGALPSDCEITGFTPSVAFTAGATISGTFTITTGGVGIEYDDGSTYTITNTDWVGPSGNPIYFRDSNAGSGSWLLDISGSQAPLQYVNVSRSDAAGGGSVNAADITNHDCGNNVDWTFGSAGLAGSAYTQIAYQWYANQDAAVPAATLAAANTSATLAYAGEPFRLRMLLAVDATDSIAGTDSFILQFAKKGTGTDCRAPQFSYTTVTTSTAIAYYPYGDIPDGAAITPTSTDPADGGRTVIEQTFQSGGTFNVTTTIPSGEDGNWDFSLVDNGGAGGTDYCFQAVFASDTLLYAYPAYPEIMTAPSPSPIISNTLLNGGSAITLLPDTTEPVTVTASVSDPDGPGNISYATSTIYRSSLGGGCASNNLNCYQVPSSSCIWSAGTSTVTCTANVWYFAQSTGGASSSFPSDTWTGAVTVTDAEANVSTASDTEEMNVLTAVNVTTSTVNFGTVIPGADTGSADQTTTVQNAGNSSTTLQISGIALAQGSSVIATSSVHYATSSFIFGGSEAQLNGSPTTVTGFLLTAPTSTTPVQNDLYWGLGVPTGMPTGTYTGTLIFSAVFSQ